MKTLAISFLVVSFLGFLNPVFSQNISYQDNWGNPGFNLISSDRNGVEAVFSVTEFTLEDVVINGENMKNVLLPGVFLPSAEGKPNLPGSSKVIAITQGAQPVVEIINMRTEVYHNMDIAPAPRIPLETEKGPLQYNKNEKVYAENAPYPQQVVILSDPGKLRGVDVVTLGITPFQYNPATKELTVYKDIRVKITFSGGNGQFGENRLRSRWWEPILADAIYNYASIPAFDFDQRNHAAPTEETGAEYLIITPTGSAFLQWADSLKKFRIEQGISTIVKTLTEVGGNTTTAIETYINNAYNTWTIPPSAILLLGDHGTDATSTVISPIYNSYCVSDNIYGDVDGNHLPDIVMARITANNASQLQVMVSKVLKYERNPPTSSYFYSHPITALGWQTERWFQICSETVGGFWSSIQGKTPVRINALYGGNPSVDPWSTATNTSTVVSYFGPSGLGYIPATPQELGGFTGGTAAQINTAINSGAFMLQHRDHGGETGWGEPAYSSSNIDGLTNTDLTYIMSINCLTGKYNYSSEVFAEKFHRYTYNGNNSGALGIMAASEVSYSFVNDTYVWGMFDNMWPEFMPAYGTNPASRGVLPAFGSAAGKYFLAQSSWPYNTGNKEVTYHLFHAHGDAFLTVYSEVPQTLTVSHSPVLYAGVTTFQVTANAGSLISLTANGAILGTATGTGSPVSITIPPQVPPTQVLVTVTKQNYKRYKGPVNVVPATGPYVIYMSHTISDPTPGGNNNNQMEFGETNLLNISLKNVGVQQAPNVVATLSSNSTYITITDNTENYGNIDPNQTVVRDNAFTYTVANNVPDQQVIPFNIESVSGTNSWTSHFNITANAPVLAIGAMSVSDPAPGGNNNGILDPGETANLVIVTTNNGHAAVGNVNATLAIVGGSSPYLTINNATSSVGTLSIGGSVNATFSVTANASTPIGTPVDLTCSLTGGTSGQYTASSPKQVVIGLIPTYIISNTTVNACVGNFYDSGGASGNYQNSENYTMTFNPSTSGSMVRAIFSAFSTESGYDYLKIYNGTSTSAPLIGSYHGSTSPGTVTASNTSGALTFNFTSDGSVVAAGWAAAISCYNVNIPPVAEFTASNTNPAVNTTITFTDQSTNIPNSWTWSITPATFTYMSGTNANSQNPQVQFTATGFYTVSLTVANAYGSNTMTKTNFINVVNCSHCASTSNNATEEWISNVTFNTINNASGGTTGYQNFTSISTTVLPGSTHSMAVTCAMTGGTWTEHCWTFVDWNQDCDFTDTGESFDLGQITGAGTMTTNITIPAGATPGSTRMRVSLKYNADPTSCESFSYGQVEDYTVIVGGGTLAVTPSNRAVSENAGSTTFSVTSSASWTASSNQTWCTVTPSGSGNGTITANYEQNTSIDPRVATITVSASGMTPVDVTVSQAAIANITLNLKVYLEGLYNGEGQMRKAQNETGNQFPGNVADQITVQLHESTAPYNQVGTPFLANLNTDGTSQVIVPAIHSGARYIAISHRNSIEIWSAAPVNLVSTPILYDFSLQSTSAYGNNLCHVDPTVYAIFCGDANKDGVVDSMDMGDIDNASGAFMMGYLITDINGDGVIDSNDMASTENNASNFIIVITP